ncbi:MAG: TPM domain-containing protein [Clostridia bacterium]|nr:TPM domain-containing protein [Clostridia bacterium]
MKRKILIAVISLFLVLLCGCEESSSFPEPTEYFFVNDFAEVLTDTHEAEIVSKAAALEQKTTAQVVVVTIESLDGQEPADYALQLGREWGVGDEEKDNGIVILLSESDREIYIAVGYGLEGALPDSKTGRIIDHYGLSLLQQDDFSSGITAITNALINEVYIEYGLEPETGYVSIDYISDAESVSEGYSGRVALSWVILLIILIVFSLLTNRHGRGGFFFFGGPGGFGSGGFGGSSGSFGGFSGGGGSFGGGGAGRKF